MKIVMSLCGLAFASTACALPQYRAEEILAPRDTEFRGINSQAVIVGRSPHATGVSGIIRHADSTLALISPPPGYEGYQVNFTDINESGQIAGTLIHAFNGTGKGFVYTEEGGFRIMNSAPNEAIASYSMTEDGLMAFTFSGGSGLWNPETNAFTHIPQPGLTSAVSGSRAAGQNWSWNNGQFSELQGTGSKFAQEINNSGTVVGYRLISGRVIAAVWGNDGSEVFLDTSSEYRSAFYSINNHQESVGIRIHNSGEFYGTVYSSIEGTININNLIVERNFNGIVGSVSRITDNRVAFGMALVDGTAKPVLLTPVPEPGTVLALGAGLAVLLRRKRAT